MQSRLGSFLSSSIGKKLVMALTGLALVGFLIVHLAGNLLLFKGDHGEAFNGYSKTLESNPLLIVAEIGLALLFIAHIYLAFRTTLENREARTQAYSIRSSLGSRTIASSSMFITGAVILGFVIIHLLDFRFRERAPDGLAAMVVRRISQPAGAIIYLVGVVALGIHLSHAVRSALQTLGVNHPRFNPTLRKASLGLALLLLVGFAAFPVVLFATRSAGEPMAKGAVSSPTVPGPDHEAKDRAPDHGEVPHR
jgi:succinate dehydrogenase / fumarate reductase cytochrome b subunit